MKDNNTNFSLNYFLPPVEGGFKRSVDPYDSDLSVNLSHMEQLVGTLVKHNSHDSYAPYLAESWIVDDSQLAWTFKFRTGLQCEDGTDINAENYISGLMLAFRNHALQKDTPIFSLLKGWSDFFNDRSAKIVGLKNIGKDTLRFEFMVPPSHWLIDYLSMPYFGFYCPSNFNENGKWRDKSKITSSGAYRLERWDHDADVITLQPRVDFKVDSDLTMSPTVSIKFASPEVAFKSDDNTLLLVNSLSQNFKAPDNWKHIQGVQGIGIFLILNAKRRVFSDIKSRKLFASLIRSEITKHSNDFKYSLVSDVFFPDALGNRAVRDDSSKDLDYSGLTFKANLKIQELNTKDEHLAFLKTFILDLSKKFNFDVDFVPKPLSADADAEVSNREMETDIYFIGVNKGSNANVGVIKMMFCSKLGVQLPDVSGEICRLTNSLESHDVNMTDAEYGQRFENILRADNSVIPMFHLGRHWFASPDLDVSALSPNMAIPRFDLIRKKK